MQKVHFTGIGEPIMLEIAIALSRKNSFSVSGSDDTFEGSSYSRLIESGLWPESPGWHADRIHKNLSAIVIGKHINENNPEWQKARELGLKIYSYAEFMFQQTRSKTRIVVSGSHGVSTVVAMILHVLRKVKMQADYLTSIQPTENDPKVLLSYESRIAVFEDQQADGNTGTMFQACKPHIAVLTGIAPHNAAIYLDFGEFIQKLHKLTEQMEVQGRLIYNSTDDNLNEIVSHLRRDIVAFACEKPDSEIRHQTTYLKTRKADIALQVFGTHNLLNLEAARLACRQIGIYDDQFYKHIGDFAGLPGRLTRMPYGEKHTVYADSSNTPAKLKTAVRAVKEQHKEQKLIACYALTDKNSLNTDFLPLYNSSMRFADVAIVYYPPTVSKQYGLEALTNEDIRKSFGDKPPINIVNDKESLISLTETLVKEDAIFIFAGPNNFHNEISVVFKKQ
ncbi:MAG: peptidoglycan synthetase [Paludibacteraceae bacterium]|nr:peptidoglycan synthetase [Paludibacteraceae bacterium]